MSPVKGSHPLPGWLRRLHSVVGVGLAISLPSSLFGMQAFVILGGLLLVLEGFWCGWQPWRAWPLRGPVVLWLGVIGFSLVCAPAGVDSFQSATSFWVLLALPVGWRMLDDQQILRWACLGFCAAALVSAGLGIYQVVSLDYRLVDWLHPAMGTRGRWVSGQAGPAAVGLFFSRLTFAHVLLFALGLTASLLAEPLGWGWRLALGAALAIMLGALFLSQTRAAVVVFAIVLTLWWLVAGWQTRRKIPWLLGGGLLVLVVAGALCFTSGLRQRLQASFSGTHDYSRLILWHSALDMLTERPLTGFGYGNFKRDCRPFVERRLAALGVESFPGVLAWAHSNVLTFAAETGLLGLFAVTLMLVVFWRRAWNSLWMLAQGPPWMRGTVRGVLLGFLAFVGSGFFHDTFFDGEVILTLFFWMGAVLSLGCWHRQAEGVGSP